MMPLFHVLCFKQVYVSSFLFENNQKASLCKNEFVFVCERGRAHTHAGMYTCAASKPPKGVIMRVRERDRERDSERDRERDRERARAQASLGALV